MPELTIIAEVAQGYEGKPAQAEMLVAAAAAAGADGVKLQLVYVEELATPDYQHYALFRSLEMEDAVWTRLAKFAYAKGLDFYLDVFGARSLALAEKIGARGVKIHSTDMANIGLIENIARSALPLVLLSCGGCHRREIVEAIRILQDKELVLLHGFQGYPTTNGANQIARLAQLTALLPAGSHRIGFADHAEANSSMRFHLPAVAIGAGASVLEKHITLANVMKIEDHESALGPDEFFEFVQLMRQCTEACAAPAPGPESFGMHASELEYRRKARKHVVAARDLALGTVLEPRHLGLKRTASMNALDDLRLALGRKLRTAVKADQALTAASLTDPPPLSVEP